MNIIEAIKSGKRFRRKGWTVVITADPTHWLQPGRNLHLSTADILATDWEVEEVRVTITESVLGAAWVKACKSSGYHDDFSPHGWLYAELKKELGL